MSRIRRRATTVLAQLPLLLPGLNLPGVAIVAGAAASAVVATPAVAAADPVQPDGRRVAPDGPYPPTRLYAGDPADVPDPTGGPTPAQCPPAPYGVSYVAPGGGRTVALTFDDGPGPSTWQLISILERYGVPATFFNIGVNEYYRPNELLAEETLGFAMGNHTWDHPMMSTLSYAAQANEMDRATAEQAGLIHEPTCIFRPPYGDYNANTLAAAYARGMSVWTWTVDTLDWQAPDASAASVNRIVSLAVAGGNQPHPVILMHNSGAGNPATVAALPSIIEYYLNHGYSFVDVRGRMGLNVPGPAAAVTAGGVHLFSRGADGGLYMRTARYGSWSGYIPLGGVIVGGPAAVALSDTVVAVFALSTDNHLWERTISDSGTGGWSLIGGTITSRPAVARAPDGTITVAVRGSDTGVWIAECGRDGWHGWQNLGGSVSSAPAVAVTLGGEITVAAVGHDRAAWFRHRGASWTPWTNAGGVITADPAFSPTTDGNRMVLVGRSTDLGAWAIAADGTATTWAGWSNFHGTLISGFSTVLEGPSIAVFAYGTDRAVWQAIAVDGVNLGPWPWPWQRVPG